jgi:adenylate kinase
MVRERLSQADAAGGAIFDGYPRNAAQAESLGRMLAELGRSIDAVVSIDVAEEAIVQRMTGRRTDPETGRVYHLVHNPPPAEVQDRLVQRDDDREATVRHRLEVYRTTTEPLVAYYRESGVPLHTVDGDRPIDQVQGEIMELLGNDASARP